MKKDMFSFKVMLTSSLIIFAVNIGSLVHAAAIREPGTVRWRMWVSDNGTFVGYTADVNWLNVWWNEQAVNPWVIP
jgi:hypothetical protein